MEHSSRIRPAAASGSFYPAEVTALRRQIEACLPTGADQQAAVGVVVPHAGYRYSGQVAGAVYAGLQLPRRMVLLCPNHTGRGRLFAIQTSGHWRTPLGIAAIDPVLGEIIRRRSNLVEEDDRAHEYEHAIEVQLPFLQYLSPDFCFVPICVGDHHLPALLELGRALALSCQELDEKVLMIASSDMSHYLTDAQTREQDRMAIDSMIRMDPEGLHRTVTEHDISMCGFGPVTTVMAASGMLGARRGVLVRYATSGETSGDYRKVVGYAGVLFQ